MATIAREALPRVCGYIGFEKLMEQVEGIRKLGLAESLKPEFLKKAAEYFDDRNTEA